MDIANSYESFSERAKNLLRETKLLQINKSANILIELFGQEAAFSKIKSKRVGQQIEMGFPALEGSLTFTLVNKREDFNCTYGKPDNPIATIVINVEDDEILNLISSIIRLKSNIIGLLRIAPKLITGKLKVKGSLFSAIKLCQLMMIGHHEVYNGQL